MTEAEKMSIHELGPIVRMERDDLPWVPAQAGLQGSNHVHLCFRPYRSCLRPSGRLIRDGQGPAKVSHRVSSVMIYQVHSQGTGDVQRRVHARLNGDPATQRDTPGMGDSMQTVHLPLPCQQSPDGGRTHLQEKPPCLLIHMEMPMRGEVLHEECHASCQTDRTKERACVPDRDQCLLDDWAIPERAVPVGVLRGVSHEDTVSQEIPLSCLVQDTGGMSPAVSRLLTEIVQHR